MENQVAPKKKIIFSGIQPTGTFQLGNYLGAVRNWVKLQEEYNCTYSIVDLHAITIRQDPVKLRKQILDSYALILACGVDPKKSIAFIQSHNPAHSQLAWTLGCYTGFGELSRMTQFKDKSARNADNINSGLFTYPVLMAADILLYKADLVPVGIDQKQHLELARDIATRFNGIHGNVFTVPDGYIPKEGAKIMSLADPTKKMSKSDENQNGCVYILDSEDVIIKKFKRAVTDSDSVIKYADGKDGINNLMSIYGAISGKSFDEIEKEFDGKMYGDFKLAVGQCVSDALKPIREEFARISADKAYLEECYKLGAERAIAVTERTLAKVNHKVGFINL